MAYDLIDVVQSLGHPRVLVVGDLILDRYVWGNAERISQEAPVILLREDRREIRPGGAANVANMLRGLEAEVTLAGVVGDDADADEILQALTSVGVDCSAVLKDPSRPTTVKQRLIGRAQNRHPHQMMRIDRESRDPVTGPVAERLCELLAAQVPQHQAVLVSDYAKGVCTPAVLELVIEQARRVGVPVIVDPASKADYRRYRGATAVTPNRLETQLATGVDVRSPEDAFTAGRMLCELAELDHVFVTLDRDGIALVTASGRAELFPTRPRQVYDITGAGDMVLATIGLGEAEGVDPALLARLANVAGGLEVEQIGVVPISREQILTDLLVGSHRTDEKICDLEVLVRRVEARRRLGHRIVFTNGCFDLLHLGHVTYLQQAAREGDCLVVAVNSDRSVRELKGPDRPLFDQQTRAAMLAALEAVDFVVVFDEPTPHRLLERLKPDVLVKGGTYSREQIVGREVVEAYGGRVKPLGCVPGVSTTQIVERIRRGQPASDAVRSSSSTTQAAPQQPEVDPVALPHPATRTHRKAG